MSFFFLGAVFVFFVGGASSVSTEVVLSTSRWRLGLLVVVLVTLFARAGCSNATVVVSSASRERLLLGAVLVAPFWAGMGGV